MLLPLTFALLGLMDPSAPPPPGWIQWEAPGHCPSAISVVRITEQRLGRTVDDDELRLEARVTEDGAEATVEFSLTRATQTERRALVGPNCATLAEAVALLVAMSLDPVGVATQLGADEDAPSANSSSATRRSGAPSSEPVPPPLPTTPPSSQATPDNGDAPQPTPDDHDTPAARRERDASLELLLQAGGGFAVGAIPRISGGPQLGLTLAWPRLRFEAGGYWIAPRSTTDGRVAVQMGAAWLRTCTRLGPARVEFPICLGAELGALRGRGGEVLNPQTQLGLWVAPQLGAGVVGWVAERVAITLRANTAIPVVSSGFVLEGGAEGDTVLFAPQRLALHVWLGVEGKFRVREGSPR